MPPEYTKIDDHTLGIKVTETKEISSAVEYNSLVTQRDAIKADKQKYTEARDAEIAQLDQLISQADHLGIVPKPESASPANEFVIAE